VQPTGGPPSAHVPYGPTLATSGAVCRVPAALTFRTCLGTKSPIGVLRPADNRRPSLLEFGPNQLEGESYVESAERPWGSWSVLGQGDGYKVKKIVVKPGHRLSYQRHAHRLEHWFVVAGTAETMINDRMVRVPTGSSIDVPRGAAHRLSNQDVVDLVVIEIQRGPYLGEDDIVRLDDDYGRCELAI